MKKNSIGVMLTLAATLGLVAAAHGQTLDALTANVPFAFVVDGTTFPAGLYSIDRASSSNPSLLLLRSEDGKPVAFVFSRPATGSAATPKLVFERSEENYFLSEIWTLAGVHQLPRSRRVDRLAKAVDHGVVSIGAAQ